MFDKEPEYVTASDVWELAEDTLGSYEKAKEWMYKVVPALGYKRPIDLLRSFDEEKRHKVWDVIQRVRYGVY